MPKPLTGYLGVNKRKTSPKHPDLTGSLQDESGKEYWASGWYKQGRDNSDEEYISIALTPKDANGPNRRPETQSNRRSGVRVGGGGRQQQRQTPPPNNPPPKPQDDGEGPPPDDDVPF